MNPFKKLASALAIAVAVAGPIAAAQAAEVRVFGEALNGFSLSTVNNFYDRLPGHNSEILAALTPGSLNNVSLLWATQPSDAYTAGELSVMSTFLGAGGRIAFMGEHGTFAPAQNLRINAALTTLGANIQIINQIVDSGFRTASVADRQIVSHPLTTGVSTFQYAAFAPLSISGTAQRLVVGEDNAANIMMAYQNIGPGSIFVITDQNVWDGAPNWRGGFDNARMFQNVLTGNTLAPPQAVPVPASLALFGMGLLGLVALRRRA